MGALASGVGGVPPPPRKLVVESEEAGKEVIDIIPTATALIIVDVYDYRPPLSADSRFPVWYDAYLTRLARLIDVAHRTRIKVVAALSSCGKDEKKYLSGDGGASACSLS